MWGTEKRQRVQRACDECKRKKKQCSGKQPCATCTARSHQCVFSNPPSSSNGNQFAASGDLRHKSPKRKIHSFEPTPDENSASDELTNVNTAPKDTFTEDETAIQSAGRLLQDGGGRLLYVGDSASLSFLQSIRRLVEGSLGVSAFTMDSNRHKIVEASISTPPGYRHTYALPDLEAASYLTNSFFDNTVGLVDIFNRENFTTKLHNTYRNPLDADSQWLCQLNLVFAVGMHMRRGKPSPLSAEGKLLERLEVGGVKRAEIFYLTAKHLKDPVCGLEDGDFGAVQSLFLMTTFMLTAAKRNTAWVFLGMAIRLAYALGIHKEETLSIFEPTEQDIRRKLWQSLYIMDCFLSSSLGRPNAISCACVAELCPPQSLNQLGDESDQLNDLIASVNASKITGEVLRRVYQKRKAVRSISYALSLQFSEWMKALPMRLHWRQISLDPQNPILTLERLHINLIYFHGVLLLTRPFLLYQISIQLKRTSNQSIESPPELQEQGRQGWDGKPEQMFCFHGACVRSAIHTINAVHAAFTSEALPRRDPFVIYWLFSATLVVLANMFCRVYCEHDSETAIHMALKVFQFCGEADPQARRYYTILESFNDTIQASHKAKQSSAGFPDGPNIFNILFGGNNGAVGFDKGLAENGLLPGLAQPWAINDAEIDGTMGALLESDGQYETPIMNGKTAGSTSWPVPSSEMPNDSIDFNGVWWSGGQDNFVLANDVQVPLYGLMEPT